MSDMCFDDFDYNRVTCGKCNRDYNFYEGCDCDKSEDATPVKLETDCYVEKYWTKKKPDFACVFLTRQNGDYNLWKFCWEIGEPPEDTNDDETNHYYLAWTNDENDEWDSIEDCQFDEYLIIEKLPTMDEVHKQFCEAERKRIFTT